MDHDNPHDKSGSIIQETEGQRTEMSASSDVVVKSEPSMAPHDNFNTVTRIPENSEVHFAKPERVSPAPSCLSVRSDTSMGQPINFRESVMMKQDRGVSPAVSNVSMDRPINFKRELATPDSGVGASSAPSCLSMKSDWSMGQPGNFKRELNTPDLGVGASPAPSCLSMRSDKSMGHPFNFRECLNEFSSSLLTSVCVMCSLCDSILRKPVSIPCGHSYCQHCINVHWSQPGPTGDYMCPQCKAIYPVRPVLSVNVALNWMLQVHQQTGFSPACPTLPQAGPGDVACDICSSLKLRAVKTCVTCSASYCENHVRHHYTVPALQKHTLVQVNEDTRLSQWEVNSGRMEDIKEESFVADESEEHQEIACKRMKMDAEEEGVGLHLSEMRIILLGYKGSGKSSSGNTILGTDEFRLERTAQCEKRQGDVAGRQVTVVNTPGWWRNYPLNVTSELIKQEIVLSASLCPPGPHVLLLVIRATSRKADAYEFIEEHMQLLSERVWYHTIILFTYGDNLLDKSIEQYIESEGEAIQRLVEKCGNRYHVFNNKNRGDDTQVTELLLKIEEMVAGDTGRCLEIDRRVLEETKKRTQEERATRRQMKVKKERESIRSMMGVGLYLSEMRIILLGYKGSGKTSSGNAILGTGMFRLKRTAQCEKRKRDVAGRQVTVVNTPGWWFNNPLNVTSELIKQEIVLSASLCPPGPHVLLLVIRATSLIADEHKFIEEHMQLLSERVWSHTIILFTFGDYLLDTSIEQYIESEGEALQRFVEKCGNRYHVFNNENRGDDTQVTELLLKIEEMVATNGGHHY